LFSNGTGPEEMIGNATAEFAAISRSHIYSVDLRCSESVVNCEQSLWTENDTNPKKAIFDPMFRMLTWNPSATLPRENYTKSHDVLRVRADIASFDLVCITTHTDWICTGSSSGHIHCFDRRRPILMSCWKGHVKSVEYLKAISRHRLLSVSGDKTAILWDMTKSPPQKISSIFSE